MILDQAAIEMVYSGMGYKIVYNVGPLQAIVERQGNRSRMRLESDGSIVVDGIPTDDHRFVARLDPEQSEQARGIIVKRYGTYSTTGGEKDVVFFHQKLVAVPYGCGNEVPATEADIESIPGVLKAIKLEVSYRGSRYTAQDLGHGMELYYLPTPEDIRLHI